LIRLLSFEELPPEEEEAGEVELEEESELTSLLLDNMMTTEFEPN
jgi:hypothetical protein